MFAKHLMIGTGNTDKNINSDKKLEQSIQIMKLYSIIPSSPNKAVGCQKEE